MMGDNTSLTFQSRTDTRDDYGGFTESWTNGNSLKGALLYAGLFVGGAEKFLPLDKVTLNYTHIFFTHYDSTVNEQGRMTDGTKTYKIISIDNISNRNKWMRIALKENT